MKTSDFRYEGSWELVPELCFYEEGEPPSAGHYLIEVRKENVKISISWTDADGMDQSIEYGGPVDGTRVSVDHDGTSQASFKHVDELTLDSYAYTNDIEIASARRRASPEGNLLATLQVSRRPGGSSFRNTQVYRRQSQS